MSKPITVADLFDDTLPEQGGPGASAFLWCPRCGGEFSATRGDYFWKPAGEAFTCRGPVGLRHRKVNLQLVRRESRLVPVNYADDQELADMGFSS